MLLSSITTYCNDVLPLSSVTTFYYYSLLLSSVAIFCYYLLLLSFIINFYNYLPYCLFLPPNATLTISCPYRHCAVIISISTQPQNHYFVFAESFDGMPKLLMDSLCALRKEVLLYDERSEEFRTYFLALSIK